MDIIWDGIRQAFTLLWQRDPEVIGIMLVSLKLSGLATLLSLCIGVPIGTFLALRRFPGRQFLVSLVNTGMGLPPVVVGLFVAITLWRSGPLGMLRLLYTPTAVVIAQCCIALPVVTGLTLAAVQQVDPKLRLQMLGIGASRTQWMALLLWEAKLPMVAAVMAAFGAVISEVGAVMMVGGNLAGSTRVLTTATVLETRKGSFDVAIALSLILLGITFVITWLLTTFQQRDAAR